MRIDTMTDWARLIFHARLLYDFVIMSNYASETSTPLHLISPFLNKNLTCAILFRVRLNPFSASLSIVLRIVPISAIILISSSANLNLETYSFRLSTCSLSRSLRCKAAGVISILPVPRQAVQIPVLILP